MKIVLTGGGTAGHVMPHIALLPRLMRDFEIHYIGSNGIERQITAGYPEITFHQIESAKLVRKSILKNLKMPFKVIAARCQAARLLKEIKPDIIFSKGGYVALPVVFAAGKIPVVTHESDLRLGLANRIMKHRCDKLLTTFEETAKSTKNAIWTGAPIRESLLSGSREAGLKLVGFSGVRPILLVIGGSLGAVAINSCVRSSLGILSKYDIIHITGKGNKIDRFESPSYHQIEFTENIADIFAATDLVVSRAGSNAITEFVALKKPMLLIPLPKGNSRGDQIDNANYLRSKNLADILLQEDLTPATLQKKLEELNQNKIPLKNAMAKYKIIGTENVYKQIINTVKINNS